jgi:hypothetical protein
LETTLTNNNRMRKTLAEQIDRLDGILDGLAEGLNDAVAGAVREATKAAVQEAVRGVLSELLTNPDLLANLRPLARVESPASPAEILAPEPGPVRALSNRLRACGRGLLGAVRLASYSLKRRLAPVGALGRWSWQRARRSPLALLTALVAGVAAGAAAFFAGPWLSAAVSGLGGCAATLAAQAGLALRRLWCVRQPQT